MKIQGAQTWKAGDTQTPVTTEDKIALLEADQQQVETLLGNLAHSQDYYQYLSEEEKAKIEATKIKLEQQLALLESTIHMLKTGEWDPNAAAQPTYDEVKAELAKLEPGWNDMSGHVSVYADPTGADATLAGTNYAGTIMLENSGSYDSLNSLASNALVFVANDDVKKISGETIGKDILVTVEYFNGKLETYVLENMAARPEPIYFYAADHSKGITIDMSKVIRVSDGNWGSAFGEIHGLTIVGGKGKDTLIGSAADDQLIGGGDDDLIYGLGGEDILFGDEYNESGAAGFMMTDGQDKMDGGAGYDILRAGGGNQDQVYNAKGDSVSEHENPGATELYEQPSVGPNEATNWLYAPDLPNSSPPKYDENGVLIIQADDINKDADGTKQLTIDMLKLAENYSMASAEPSEDGEGLIITMAGFKNGQPITLKIEIKGFFDPANAVNLSFTGRGILDFHEVVLSGSNINIIGSDENDTILMPQTYLDTLGLSIEQLQQPTISTEKLEKFTERLHKNLKETHQTAIINEQGEIVFTKIVPEWPESMNFEYPYGYTDAILMQDPDSDDMLLIFLKQTPDGFDRIVVRLTDATETEGQAEILAGGVPVRRIDAVPTVDAQGGDHDTIFASQSGADTSNDHNEHVITGDYDFTYFTPTTAKQTITEQLAELDTDITALENKVTKFEQSKDTLTDAQKQEWEDAKTKLAELKALKEELEKQQKGET